MNSFYFYLTNMGFVSVIIITLSLVVTLYLVRRNFQSPTNWLLMGFFFAVIANSITMLFANAWLYWGHMLMPAQDAWILLGGVALAQFAYHYPRYDQKAEARTVLVFTSIIALFAIAYSIYYAVFYIFYYTPGMNENQTYYLLLPLMTLFIIAIFLRRAVHYASFPAEGHSWMSLRLKELATALVHPQNGEVRTLRDYALALSLGLLPGMATFVQPISFIPDWLPSYMLSAGSVLVVAALALVFLNNSGEQTSFIVKVMGISLVTFLLIFGAFGLSVLDRAEKISAEADIYQLALTHQAIRSNDVSSIPDTISYVIPWTIVQDEIDNSGTTRLADDEDHGVLYIPPNDQDFRIQSLVEENRLFNAGVYPNIKPVFRVSNPQLEKLTSVPWQGILRYGTFPYGSIKNYDGYLFTDHDVAFEIGVNYLEKLKETHNLVLYLLSWVAISSLIIIFLFPIFYRANLVQPLNQLLSGVKQANRGDLNIEIPVQYEDEIGFLTRSFNHMVASLHQTNQARDELVAELHQRMQELHLSEEKFFKAFHSSPVGMMLQDGENLTYLDVNSAFTQVTGYERTEAIGQSPGNLNLYPTQDEARRVSQAWLDADGCLRNFEFKFQRKSGEVGTGLLSSEVFELQGRKTTLGIVMDITERKQAEEEIYRLNLEMENRVADRSRELSTFLDLAFLVSHHDSLDQIFLPALERILEISGFQVVSIHAYSPDRQYLTLEAQVGLDEPEADQMCVLLPDGNFASWLSQPRDALLLSDLQHNNILPNHMQLTRMRSCLVAQLVAQGEVMGILTCFREDVHTFSLEEISLLVAVAEQLGISLENYRLRQEAEKAAITTERRRLARDLHDSITQSMYGLTLFTRSSKDALLEGDLEKLNTSLEQIEANATLALRELRLLLYQMQPQGLQGGFLNEINTRLDLVEHRLGIQATCQVDDQISLPPELEQTLFRIALEALNNSLKHAQANHVYITLAQNNETLWLEVSDDGKGFDYSDQADVLKYSGMGLKNMHARANEFNGTLVINSSPGNGTSVRVFVDLGSVHN